MYEFKNFTRLLNKSYINLNPHETDTNPIFSPGLMAGVSIIFDLV